MSQPPVDLPAPFKRRAWGWFLVGVLLLIGALAVVIVDMRRYFSVAEIQLPSFVGLPYDQAAANLRREGLEPVSFLEYSPGLPGDVVSSQAPEPGTVVKRGRSVHLGVNTPPAEASIPDLVGLQQAEALASAAGLNLPVGLISFEPSERAAGRVIAQDPPAGQRLGQGRQLLLTVSSGQARPAVQVPELSGMNVDDAVIQLHALGFRLVETAPAAVSFVGPGAVVATLPPAGQEVAASTPIIVQYALSTANVVRVPELLGLPQWRAQLALRAAQLQVGQVTYVQDASLPEGVTQVQPTGYTLPGTPVLLTINGTEPSPLFPDGTQGTLPDLPLRPVDPALTPGASGGPHSGAQADGSRQVPFSFDPTFMGVRRLLEEPYDLKVMVVDEQGERTVLDRTLQAGQSINTTLSIYGDEAMLQTYIDGVFFQAWRP